QGRPRVADLDRCGRDQHEDRGAAVRVPQGLRGDVPARPGAGRRVRCRWRRHERRSDGVVFQRRERRGGRGRCRGCGRREVAMSYSDPTKAPKAHPKEPEAELPQAPPGAPEGHDSSSAQADRPQPDPEVAPQPAAPAGPDSAVEAAQPEAPSELETLAAKAEKADEYLALAQRTQADFENYRKRATRDARAAQERGAIKLALALLPAIDNLDRALAHADEVVADGAGNGAASLVTG